MNESPEIAKEDAEEELFVCSKCGADVSGDDKFCRKCGADVSEIEEDIDDESAFEIEGDDAVLEKSDTDVSENDSWW
jgi:ribosomal protein L40E